jgi:hypothetical protein
MHTHTHTHKHTPQLPHSLFLHRACPATAAGEQEIEQEPRTQQQQQQQMAVRAGARGSGTNWTGWLNQAEAAALVRARCFEFACYCIAECVV